HEGALRIAERAQRIEPRNPEVYLLMASAQFGLYRLDAAEQLARRGLSLSRAGTLVNGQLQGLFGRIAGARSSAHQRLRGAAGSQLDHIKPLVVAQLPHARASPR